MELSPGETEPAPGSLEQVAAAALFTEGRPVLLASSGDPAVRARGAVMAWLGAEVGGKYLRNNDRIFFFGLMLAALVVGLAAWMAKSPVTVLVQAGGSAAAALILLPPLIRRATRSPATAKVLGWLGKNPRPIVGLLLLLLLLAHQVLSPVLPLSLALLLALAGVLVLFWHLLRRPTPAALALGEALEGYREFLGGKGTLEPGQEEDLDFFVRHLPFALALDLGPAWEERFEGALEARGVPPVLAPRDSLPPMAGKEYLEALRRAVGSGEHGPADRDGG